MSQVIEANCPILSNPPWKGGKAKYRLGLKPINLDEWFDATINPDIYKHKKSLIDSGANYKFKTVRDFEMSEYPVYPNFMFILLLFASFGFFGSLAYKLLLFIIRSL